MSRKPKFNPEITRVKLNPEQAVLACPCWQGTLIIDTTQPRNLEGCVANQRLTARGPTTATSGSMS